MEDKLSDREIEALCKTNYIVVDSIGHAALTVRVNQMRKHGFEPVGEITKVTEGSKHKLWQAMRRAT
jgi:hypothetical protein